MTVPAEKLVTLNSYEQSAEEYAKNTESLHPEKEGKQFLSLLPLHAKVIDIGCGPGRDVKIFSSHGLDVVGIDFSSKLIEIAKENAPKCSFHVMDIEALDFPKESFDGAWANCSLLHVPKQNIPSILNKIHSILQPQGIFYLSLKQANNRQEVLEQDVRYGGLKKFWSFFEQEEIELLLKAARFTILSSELSGQKMEYHTHPLIKIFAQKELLL